MSKKTSDRGLPLCSHCGSELVSVHMDVGAYEWFCPVCELGSGPETVPRNLRSLGKWVQKNYGNADIMLTHFFLEQIDTEREMGRLNGVYPSELDERTRHVLTEMATFHMRDELDWACRHNHWMVSHNDVWTIVENAHVLDDIPEAYCNNCGTAYRENDLDLFKDGDEWFKGCPKCETDGHLRYFDEMTSESRLEILRKWTH